MGFLANMAAKSEMKLRDQVLTCFDDFSNEFEMNISTGNVLLPCHIISEAHNGFFVQYENEIVGVFRCQNHWWLHELDDETVQGLRSPESQKWMNKLSKQRPVDGGELQGGIPPFVASMLMMLKQFADEALAKEAEKKAAEKELKKLKKQGQIASRQLQVEKITDVVNRAAILLWDSGCEMRVALATAPADKPFPDHVVVFSLLFKRIRGDWPIYLYADMAARQWQLSDSHIPKAGTVTAGPIEESSKTTAIAILQLIVEHGFKNWDLSSTQRTWAQYIDSQFLPLMTGGILPELLAFSSDQVKKDTQVALDSMIESYSYYPGAQHSLQALIDLRNR